MDLKIYYLRNIRKTEYHYRFFDAIKNVNKIYNVFEGYIEAHDYKFEIYDEEEAIDEFKKLCQPEKKCFEKDDKCWFYLITYYLHKSGYIIYEFPKLLERPPVDPTDFTYREIRNNVAALSG